MITGKSLNIPLLFIMIAVFVLMPGLYSQQTTDPGYSLRFILLCLIPIMFFLRSLFGKRKHEFNFFGSKILLFLIPAQVIWMLFSILQSVNQGEAFVEVLRIAMMLTLMGLTIYSFQNAWKPAVFTWFSLIAIAIFSGFGLYQILLQLRDAASESGVLFYAVSSSLANKNFFAEALVLLIPFSLFTYGATSSIVRLAMFLCCVLALVWIFALQSVGAFFGVISALLVWLIFYKPFSVGEAQLNRRKFIKAALILSVIITILLVSYSNSGIREGASRKFELAYAYFENPDLIYSSNEFNNNSVYERILAYSNSLKLFCENPSLGSGLNNWKLLQGQFGIGGTKHLNTGVVQFEHPHNDYLLILAEQGIPGLLIFLLFYFFLLREVKLKLRLCTDNSSRAILSACAAVLTAFLVMSFFSYPRMRIFSYVLVMIASATILALPGTRSYQIKWHRIYSMLLLLVSMFALYLSYTRFKSEVISQKIQLAQLSRNYGNVIRYMKHTKADLFPLTDAVTPLSWYEGVAYFNFGKTQEALESFKSASYVHPWHPRVLQDLATAYSHLGMNDSAMFYYRKAMKVIPQCQDCILNLSATYYNNGEIENALNEISRFKRENIVVSNQADYNAFLKAILHANAESILNHHLKADSGLFIKLTENFGLEKIFYESLESNEEFSKCLIREAELFRGK
ncbi:MAG: hypothetical protein DWQ44_02455 [Bacteroidetes bacterium]|nr:MAG: hypothetical protein DWQ33_06185 [Bacteroidota bacterium]REK04833.1 MAG: hypothetical protein DWQ39_06350 [Bacteroidota bacterium]REK36305.1 MAG: hypothetical protein DWQ44_02455 [Bacteroidota bacterium]REK51029.1 MAG: hypothetical protein DWQ48_02765 [Bacteroidota bacterium]